MNQPSITRWGILSTAAIARKNWRAIAHTESGQVTAVASRQPSSAELFVRECQLSCPQKEIPTAFGSYDALLASPDVDAVYIPLPTGIRKEWILKAVRAGKHVLAEKPAALSAADLEEILSACQERQVQYMDGVMFMHSGRLPLLQEAIHGEQGIGPLRRIATHFSFYGDNDFLQHNIRSNRSFEPHGALGDLGWYCVRLILWANAWREPVSVSGRCLSTIQGVASAGPVPSEFSGELVFDNGVSASFYCSFITENQQWAHFSGDRGSVWIDDFVLPFYGSDVGFEINRPEFIVRGCDFHMHRRARRVSISEYSEGHAPAQEINMFETFHRALATGKPDTRWGEMSLATQRVLDQLLSDWKQG